MILILICCFTFLIHASETGAYCLRLSGLKTGQIAIAMSFVTSTLLISRLSNMFQAPLLGVMVDSTVATGTAAALRHLEMDFRLVIFAAFLGSLAGIMMTPTLVNLFSAGIRRFLATGSVPQAVAQVFYPHNWKQILACVYIPRPSDFSKISLKTIPKKFLLFNIFVTSIYTIGVLCSLLAGAHMPDLRATAINLSGIVNGMATILLTIFVDPAGARITDQTYHGVRPWEDAVSVVFFLQMGRLVGTLILAQILFGPLTCYITNAAIWVTAIAGH